ncbi:MAG: ParB/RepB/Spo0J family partition protein [Clostridia bacterium]|nr:ParB/RepB/Spo0J family partition protein [Clostridia bacterium]
MKRRTHIQLTPYEDLFSTEEQRQDYHREKVMDIPLSELHPFKDHPFKVMDDDRMADTTCSIQERGVLVPAIARPRPDGGYELISGHRRKRACELAGFDTMPVIVREMDDNAAVLVMVDSNIQRENILPSERAFAYKMKLEALRRQGKRSDLTSSQVGMKLQALDIVGQESGESRNQVHRYIRLTHLIPQLLTMVDEKKIAFNPAVELSYLKQEEQAQLLDAMESEQATPSLSQAQRMKRFSQEDKLSPAVMSAILSEEKKVEQEQVSFSAEALRKYFPKSYTPQQMETVIFRLLDTWQRKRQQQQER